MDDDQDRLRDLDIIFSAPATTWSTIDRHYEQIRIDSG
jgi:hypothetical protein